ncbi:MAG: hypothetical protein ACJAS4_000871 [Bacteriovoracaceae bacterium]|jgi:hypothetical protein
MKLLLIGVILSFNINASAAADDPSVCKHCVRSLSGTPVKAVPGDFQALAKAHPAFNPIEELGSLICIRYNKSFDVAKDVKNLVSNYIKKNDLGSGNEPNVVDFLNTNKDLLNCPDINNKKLRRNIIKMAIAQNNIKPMIYKFLFKISKTSGTKVDFNAVDYIDGKFETPLDYIDNLIATKKNKGLLKKLNQLKEIMVINFGAKNFVSLSPVVRSQYENNGLYAKN